MENTPTFAERAARMRAVAEQLREIAAAVQAEADAMHAAAQRFAAKKAKRAISS